MKEVTAQAPRTVGDIIRAYADAYNQSGIDGMAVYLHERIDLLNSLSSTSTENYNRVLAQEITCIITAYSDSFRDLMTAMGEPQDEEVPFT